jgi:Ser/Thr protein kinase RdoA (MazF antagonist)
MLLTEADLRPALRRWIGLDDADVRLLNYSENQTFAVTSRLGDRFCLRVHRPGYHARAGIESELAWLSAVGRDTSVPVPLMVSGADGKLLQNLGSAEDVRFGVLFRFVAGSEPTIEDDLSGLFFTLGGYAATLHNHVLSWERPAGFERPAWTAQTILPADGLWGDWRQAPGVDKDLSPVLQHLEETLSWRLSEYGTSPERFGLVHADMRLGNLLVDDSAVTLIDFDDCGLCWFTYDFAAALSFHEAHPSAPKLLKAWLAGYETVRQLDEVDVSSIETMVMLRRMALLAWTGSHAETKLARTHMDGFAATTARLAEHYLAGCLWPD